MLANTGGKQEKPPWENMSAVLQTHKNQWYKKPLHWSILKTQPTIFFSHYEEYFTKQTPSSSCSCLHPARKRYKACPQTAFQAAFNKIPKIWVPFAMPYSVSRSRSKHLDLNISVLFKKPWKAESVVVFCLMQIWEEMGREGGWSEPVRNTMTTSTTS